MEYREDQEVRLNNISSRGIVIKEGKLLVMFRRKNGKEYHVVPGGHMRTGETPEETVVREVEEETTIKCKVSRKAFDIVDFANPSEPRTEHYFICNYLSGEPVLSGEESRRASEDNFYKPMWFDINNLNNILLYPGNIKDWLKINY